MYVPGDSNILLISVCDLKCYSKKDIAGTLAFNDLEVRLSYYFILK